MAHVTFEYRSTIARDFYSVWEFNLLAAIYGTLPDDKSATIEAADKLCEANPHGYDFVCTIVCGHTEITDHHLTDIKRVLLYTCQGMGDFKFMVTATDGEDTLRTLIYTPPPRN